MFVMFIVTLNIVSSFMKNARISVYLVAGCRYGFSTARYFVRHKKHVNINMALCTYVICNYPEGSRALLNLSTVNY